MMTVDQPPPRGDTEAATLAGVAAAVAAMAAEVAALRATVERMAGAVDVAAITADEARAIRRLGYAEGEAVRIADALNQVGSVVDIMKAAHGVGWADAIAHHGAPAAAHARHQRGQLTAIPGGKSRRATARKPAGGAS